jgi:hypothetical protein
VQGTNGWVSWFTKTSYLTIHAPLGKKITEHRNILFNSGETQEENIIGKIIQLQNRIMVLVSQL